MAFEWKGHKDIFKGPGIYHLTFAVAGRRPLLGELVRILDDGSFAPVRDARGERTDPQLLRGHWDADLFGHHTATVRLKPLGYEISEDLQHLSERHPGYQLCCKQVMDNHLHLVIWVHDDGGKSIRQWAHAFRLGITQLARSKGLWPIAESPSHSVLSAESLCGAVAVCKPPVPQGESQWASGTRPDTNGSLSAAAAAEEAGAGAGLAAGAGAGLVLEMPFIRTLAHKGQIRRMIDYTHNNPDNALMVREHPHWYHIRRSRVIAGLRFDTMGKERLLDYPDTSVIALPRALSPEQIAAAVQQALWNAERGCVTYTAAINAGEKAVARAIREAGYPLVVLLLDGFPAEGTEAARFFHPGMAYHQACGEGRLFLMAPHPDNYLNPELIARTEAAIKAKDERKGYAYRPLPHSSTRWRMIAGNVMLALCAGQVQ